MDKREKVIRGLECCVFPVSKGFPYQSHIADRSCEVIECPYRGDCDQLLLDSLELLKVQELPPVKPEILVERTKEWLDKMTAEERLEEIAAILDDWDGYRTAKGLGGLINEVWAYALYPVKAQEPGWISVNDKLPDCNGLYLVWRPHFFGGEIGEPVVCYFDGQDTWHDSYGVDFERILNTDDVTHWMPLPEPPKEG